MTRYTILRFYRDERPALVVARGLTLGEAQAHCRREDTRGEGWFDGYEAEVPYEDSDQRLGGHDQPYEGSE